MNRNTGSYNAAAGPGTGNNCDPDAAIIMGKTRNLTKDINKEKDFVYLVTVFRSTLSMMFDWL